MILEDLKLSFEFKIFTRYLVLQNIQLMILESRNNGIKKMTVRPLLKMRLNKNFNFFFETKLFSVFYIYMI